jgi:ectoine hydroxylase-related dioxygenase (phytanoyl-CoA dioxygenase family)/DNA-binding PadR family transcriptional regulator
MSLDALEHESAIEAAGETALDSDGYVVGREVFAPELVREVRESLVAALLADGKVERVAGEEDRFRWVGGSGPMDRPRYLRLLEESVEELLMATGVANAAIERLWGRRIAIWQHISLFAKRPSDEPAAADREAIHRDGGQLMGAAPAGEHVRMWCPLSQLHVEDGGLTVAAGSQRIANRHTDEPPQPRVLHESLESITGMLPPEDVLAPLWRTPSFDVGDALLFYPGVVHGSVPNRGACLRMAMVLWAQDARAPLPPVAELSLDSGRDLAHVEWLVLALNAIQATSRQTARAAFYPRGIFGRLWTEQPPERIERTFTTLEARGLIKPHELYTDHGPFYRLYQATARGRLEVPRWLTTPVGDDRRLLSLKLLLCDWLDIDTTPLLLADEAEMN